MIYGILLAVMGGGLPAVPAQGDCLTKHGVTHCWERLGTWNPIPQEYLYQPMDVYPVDKLGSPKDWGEYATEKRN